MSHHGNDDNPDSDALKSIMRDAIGKAQKSLQGEFPNGRLNTDDEGALAVGIGHQEGKVVLSFPSPTTWVGFTPEQAFDIAEGLIEHARACGCKRMLTLTIGAK